MSSTPLFVPAYADMSSKHWLPMCGRVCSNHVLYLCNIVVQRLSYYLALQTCLFVVFVFNNETDQ